MFGIQFIKFPSTTYKKFKFLIILILVVLNGFFTLTRISAQLINPKLGDFDGAKIINNNNVTITFTVLYTVGMKSIFCHLIPNRRSGIMHNVEKIFTWTEPLEKNLPLPSMQ